MGVATYDNVRMKGIQESLPSTDQIKAVIEEAEEDYNRRQSEKQ